ncbi:unnamed protein product [Symbiodinium necroappetens]|uniref:Uncharacterized protein n=1 Tax=Symbiodinium necroappetens TaxID=1628268 RepID=A0A813CGG6_9DINO|nr:unnamed protein product [Symbiodinium necroappetens]
MSRRPLLSLAIIGLMCVMLPSPASPSADLGSAMKDYGNDKAIDCGVGCIVKAGHWMRQQSENAVDALSRATLQEKQFIRDIWDAPSWEWDLEDCTRLMKASGPADFPESER